MVNKANIWKPIEIEGSIFAGVENLIGIEECTQYDINIISKKKTKHKLPGYQESPITNKKKKKEVSKERTNNTLLANDLFSPSKCGNTMQDIGESPHQMELEEDIANLETWSRFGLPHLLLKALQDLKYTQPTEIQSLTLPAAILGRRDILGAAETGSGKTLAFGLPILTGILKIKEQCTNSVEFLEDSDSKESDFEKDISEIGKYETGCIKLTNDVEFKGMANPLYALILTPTRELAMQVKAHLDTAAKYTGINIAVVVGGMAAVKQERILLKGPEVVVATPGRLWELIQQGNSHLSQIDNIRFLAIDETDRMLERGHFHELHDLLERINFDEKKKKQRQNFVFSATLSLVHELPSHLKTKSKIKKTKKIHDMTPAQKLQQIVNILGITNPKIVDITQGAGTSQTLTECRISCGIQEKDYYVYYFLKQHPGRTLIFCNSIGCVKRLSTLLSLLDCHPLPLHASMQQRQRLRNLERFRDTKNSVLVATDVAARGLDIPCIEHVLHYQTPRTSESYVHRSGRTARASQQGITILLIEPNELKNYLKLCRTLGKGEDLPTFPVQENYLNAVKQRVNLARELDKLQLQVKKANSETGWFQKAAEDMDIVVEDFAKKYDAKETETIKKTCDIKRKQLSFLLGSSIFSKGFGSKYPFSSEQISNMFTKEEQKEKAINIMKHAIEIGAKRKDKNIPLYKPKKNFINKDIKRNKLNKYKDGFKTAKKGKKFRGKFSG